MPYPCKWLGPVRDTIETRRQGMQGYKRSAKDLGVQEVSPESGTPGILEIQTFRPLLFVE